MLGRRTPVVALALALCILAASCSDSPEEAAEKAAQKREVEAAEAAMKEPVDWLFASRERVNLVPGPGGQYVDTGCIHTHDMEEVIDTVVFYGQGEDDEPIPLQISLLSLSFDVETRENRVNTMFAELKDREATEGGGGVTLTPTIREVVDDEYRYEDVTPTVLNTLGRFVKKAHVRLSPEAFNDFVELEAPGPYSADELNCIHNGYGLVYQENNYGNTVEEVTGAHYYSDIGIDPQRPLGLMELPVDKSMVGNISGDVGGVFLFMVGGVSGSVNGSISEEFFYHFIVHGARGESYPVRIPEERVVLVYTPENVVPSIQLRLRGMHEPGRYIDAAHPEHIYDIIKDQCESKDGCWQDVGVGEILKTRATEVVIFTNVDRVLKINNLPEDWATP